MSEDRDPSLNTLLSLHGQVLVVDPEGAAIAVKFVVTRVQASPGKLIERRAAKGGAL